MIRKSVNSSNLKSVGYNRFQLILEIEFKRGGVYQYFGVPESIYQGLMNASSHGRYFHEYIKYIYRYSRA